MPGFGARRQRSEAVASVLLYRTPERRSRRLTIGRHGAPWTPDTAREEARRLLGKVAEGADPAADQRARRDAATVSELCDLYLADVEAGRVLTRRKVATKASTLAIDKGRVEQHISDAPMEPGSPHSTMLTQAEEAMDAKFRRRTLLPLDDVLGCLRGTIPKLTRASLHRCLERHGISRRPEDPDKASKRGAFADLSKNRNGPTRRHLGGRERHRT